MKQGYRGAGIEGNTEVGIQEETEEPEAGDLRKHEIRKCVN